MLGEQKATFRRFFVKFGKLVGNENALIFTEHTFLWSSVDFII